MEMSLKKQQGWHEYFSLPVMCSALVSFLCLPVFQTARAQNFESWKYMRTIEPQQYICYRSPGAVEIDGRLDDPSWKAAPWTNYFVDIEGSRKQPPRFMTRAKMLWDKYYFYIGAELEEPHVWGTLLFHDQVICRENDFEIFIDPNADNHEYYEIEIGPLNTTWELFLKKPYKDFSPGMSADTTWDIPGMKTAVYVDGTINDPRDTDRGWSVEFAIPWSVLAEYAHKPCPPENGDMWRVNFSRVEVVHEIVTADYTPQDRTNNAYRRKEGIPEDNWVWSPQGVINMHCPEKWGYVRFSASTGDHEEFRPDFTAPARTVLLDIYYAQRDFHTAHNRWASSLTDLGLDYRGSTFLTRAPVLEITAEGYRAAISYSTTDGKSGTLTISQDSRIGE